MELLWFGCVRYNAKLYRNRMTVFSTPCVMSVIFSSRLHSPEGRYRAARFCQNEKTFSSIRMQSALDTVIQNWTLCSYGRRNVSKSGTARVKKQAPQARELRNGGVRPGEGVFLPNRLGHLGEPRELPQWGPGQSPGRQRIFSIF